MKQIIIFLLLVIAILIGYGKYNQYIRYNSPGADYETDAKIDLDYHSQETLMNYHNAVEALNSYVKVQWSANDIDVRTPKDDNEKSKVAVEMYGQKKAKVKYYEAQLEKSAKLKEDGLSNDKIKYLEAHNISKETALETQRINTIKNMFNPSRDLRNKEQNVFIYEVQKRLVANGFNIKVDGVYLLETSDAIKGFEKKNNLFADGKLDELTVEALFN